MNDERPANTFLAKLPAQSWKRLEPELKAVTLALGKLIYTPGDPVRTVYFPVGGLISQVNRSADGIGVETAMIGADGAGGILESLGSGRSIWESMVQVDGPALTAPAPSIRRLASEDTGFNFACWGLAETQAFESQQSVACQALHPGEHRLARWLLEAHDRTLRRNPLPVTQEVVATMLGVQRTTVSSFQATLQRRGLISVRRGRLSIDDREALESLACPCRQLMKTRREEVGQVPPN